MPGRVANPASVSADELASAEEEVAEAVKATMLIREKQSKVCKAEGAVGKQLPSRHGPVPKHTGEGN
jgi:hypothetical protein